MASQSRRRLIRDFKKLQCDPPHGVSGSPAQNDIMKWHAVIFGPEDTPWEGGTFQLELSFNEDYPNKPPKVKFLSKLFHPNIYNDGNICLDILQNQWSPIYDVAAILTSIQSLLSDPNPNSPANSEAARLYAENRREYNRRVQECAAESWRNIDLNSNNNNTHTKKNNNDDVVNINGNSRNNISISSISSSTSISTASSSTSPPVNSVNSLSFSSSSSFPPTSSSSSACIISVNTNNNNEERD